MILAMRVSDSARVLFVHVQKTGGSTLDHMLDHEVPDVRKVGKTRHTTYRNILKLEPELEDYWAFGFVRNPWARMVSWFTMIEAVFNNLDEGKPRTVRKFQQYGHIWEHYEPYRHDFDTFVLEGAESVKKVRRNQIDMLRTPDGKQVDFIGRTENFVPDLNVVREKLGLAPMEQVPRKNATSKAHYSTYYNAQTRDKVAELYARDIEEFGYTFEDRS